MKKFLLVSTGVTIGAFGSLAFLGWYIKIINDSIEKWSKITGDLDD